jgi:transcription elongation factor GreA
MTLSIPSAIMDGFCFVIRKNKMDKIPLTAPGFEALQKELHHLKSVERPEVIQAIAEARAHGDLSENAEYSSARERQSFIEGRIEDLEAVISRADVIDPKTLSGETVKFGATVTVVDEEDGDEATYQIVGEYEADIDNNKISIGSPLSRAMIGKGVGDTAAVNTPKGRKNYEIIKVAFA